MMELGKRKLTVMDCTNVPVIFLLVLRYERVKQSRINALVERLSATMPFPGLNGYMVGVRMLQFKIFANKVPTKRSCVNLR